MNNLSQISSKENKILDTQLHFNDDSLDQIETRFEKDEIINKDVFFTSNKKIRQIGNMYTFLYTKQGSPLIAIGPHCNNILTQGHSMYVLHQPLQ
jgi:hypothetical protein